MSEVGPGWFTTRVLTASTYVVSTTSIAIANSMAKETRISFAQPRKPPMIENMTTNVQKTTATLIIGAHLPDSRVPEQSDARLRASPPLERRPAYRRGAWD